MRRCGGPNAETAANDYGNESYLEISWSTTTSTYLNLCVNIDNEFCVRDVNQFRQRWSVLVEAHFIGEHAFKVRDFDTMRGVPAYGTIEPHQQKWTEQS